MQVRRTYNKRKQFPASRTASIKRNYQGMWRKGFHSAANRSIQAQVTTSMEGELVNTQLQMHMKTVPQPSLASVERGLLQRKCACGEHTSAGGECEECRQKREGTLQRAAVNTASTRSVPPIVHDVLSSAGQPL